MRPVSLPSAGELNRRVTIRLQTDVPNAGFGVDQTFDAGITRWAKVEPVHSLNIRAGMQTGEVPTHLIWVRRGTGTRAEDITAGHVVDLAGRRYRVVATINVADADVYTRIEVKDLGGIA